MLSKACTAVRRRHSHPADAECTVYMLWFHTSTYLRPQHELLQLLAALKETLHAEGGWMEGWMRGQCLGSCVARFQRLTHYAQACCPCYSTIDGAYTAVASYSAWAHSHSHTAPHKVSPQHLLYRQPPASPASTPATPPGAPGPRHGPRRRQPPWINGHGTWGMRALKIENGRSPVRLTWRVNNS